MIKRGDFIKILAPLYTTSYFAIRIEKGGGFFCPAPHFGGRGQNVALFQNGRQTVHQFTFENVS